MKVFDTEGIEWKPAFRRAAFFVGLWLVTIYALSVAFPGSFNLGLDTGGGILALLVNAVLFFFFFTMITAFSERRKKRARRASGQNTQRKDKSPTAAASAQENGEDGPGNLKGRHNPNTSRKKASRRRRR